MEVLTIEAGQVFPQLKGENAKVKIPFGQYDDNDPVDQHLKSLIPGVDPYYRFPGRQVISLLLAFANRDNVLLVGSTGVGKTMLAMQLAAKLMLPAVRNNLHGELGSPELFGYFGLPNPNIPNDDGWKWTSLLKGIQHPGVVLLDEWDSIRAELSIGLQRLLEDHEPGLMLPERDQFIPRHKDCIVVATANTRGLGDETGLYAGTGAQNFAQLNRFHLVMDMEPLPAKNLAQILEKVEFYGQALKPELVDALTKFYSATLSSWEQAGLTTPVSVRMMLHFAKYFLVLKYEALGMTILSKLPTQKDKEIMLGIADRFNFVDPNRTSSK